MKQNDNWWRAVNEGRTEDAERMVAEVGEEVAVAINRMAEAVSSWFRVVAPALVQVAKDIKPLLDVYREQCWAEYRVAGEPDGQEEEAMWAWNRRRNERMIAENRLQQRAEQAERRRAFSQLTGMEIID